MLNAIASDGLSDVFFLTAGAMCWMPDLRNYFQTAFRVTKPKGCLILWETHPFLEMFKPDRDRKMNENLEMYYSYFMNEPIHFQCPYFLYMVLKEISVRDFLIWYWHQ